MSAYFSIYRHITDLPVSIKNRLFKKLEAGRRSGKKRADQIGIAGSTGDL